MSKLFVALLFVCSVSAADECYKIYGFKTCGYYKRAVCWAQGSLSKDGIEDLGSRARAEYKTLLTKLKGQLPAIGGHTSSPLVLKGPCGQDNVKDATVIGGSDAFVAHLKSLGKNKPDACQW